MPIGATDAIVISDSRDLIGSSHQRREVCAGLGLKNPQLRRRQRFDRPCPEITMHSADIAKAQRFVWHWNHVLTKTCFEFRWEDRSTFHSIGGPRARSDKPF
jgi:hypothetical protein